MAIDEKPYPVHAFKTSEEATGFFEEAYNRKHNSGYEASMSACINFIQFQPKIIKINGMEDLKKIAADPPKLVSIGGVAGWMTGITTSDLAKKLWEEGISPKLISKETFDAQRSR
jgi:hypothetical protein